MKKYTSVYSFEDAVINLLSDDCVRALENDNRFEKRAIEFIHDYFEQTDDPSPKEMAKNVERDFKVYKVI